MLARCRSPWQRRTAPVSRRRSSKPACRSSSAVAARLRAATRRCRRAAAARRRGCARRSCGRRTRRAAVPPTGSPARRGHAPARSDARRSPRSRSPNTTATGSDPGSARCSCKRSRRGCPRPSSAAEPARPRRGRSRPRRGRCRRRFYTLVRRISRSASDPRTTSSPARAHAGPGVGPGDAADESLPGGFQHLGHRVDVGDLLEPGLQQGKGRVGGGEEDQRHRPGLHQRCRRLAPVAERQHRPPAGGDRGRRGDHQVTDQQAVEAGPFGADHEGDREHEGRRDQRPGARCQHVAGEQYPARGRGDE